jgi:DNA-binding Xre family transcriptional regulator
MLIIADAGSIVNGGSTTQTGFMPIRLRFPELLEERGLSGYALSVATGGKISMSTVYRWLRARGRIQTIDTSLLEALCVALDAGPAEVLAFKGKRRRPTR